MQLFYTTDIQNGIATLPPEEAIHCTKTLRKGVGDTIQIVDGKGGFYEGIIIGTGKKTCTVSIEKEVQNYQKRPFHLHLAIAPTKNINRFEWFLEKATEFGIDEITPILCFHSERKNIRLDRLEKVVQAAMKQSLKAYCPSINDLTEFSTFLEQHQSMTHRYIAHCRLGEKKRLDTVYSKGESVLILIGPEGDFSEQEVEIALNTGFQPITLGEARLRTETAGIAACHLINFLNTLCNK